jgi:adenylate cyclase class IV
MEVEIKLELKNEEMFLKTLKVLGDSPVMVRHQENIFLDTYTGIL